MKSFGRFFTEILDERLQSIHNKLNTMATTQADFDAKLATLQPKIDKIKADTEALLAKASASGVDLTAESTSLQASLDALDAIDAEANPAPAAGN
jgi:F0F1-type ATP synthase membrane subunit b/b'